MHYKLWKYCIQLLHLLIAAWYSNNYIIINIILQIILLIQLYKYCIQLLLARDNWYSNLSFFLAICSLDLVIKTCGIVVPPYLLWNYVIKLCKLCFAGKFSIANKERFECQLSHAATSNIILLFINGRTSPSKGTCFFMFIR